MKEIPYGTIDMILCDLPYGTTYCSWDSIIQLDELWKQYNRICKKNAAMVFTAAQPFTTTLIASNIKNFRYDWIWVKNGVTNFPNAKKMPLRNYESVAVFYRKPCLYNPQGLIYYPKKKKTKNGKVAGGETMNAWRAAGNEYVREYTNYPRQTLEIKQNSRNQIHPTQKPVELFEYLIRTYTNEGDLVLDNTAGSGTTAIAAENTNRKWICIEQSEEYTTKAVERIQNHQREVKIDSNIQMPASID